MEEGSQTLDIDGGDRGSFVERMEEGISCAKRKLRESRLDVRAGLGQS